MNAADTRDRGEHEQVARAAVAPPPPAPRHQRDAEQRRARSRPTSIGRVADRPSPAAISATSTGAAPTTSAAWLTLVRSMPAFWSTMTAPKPTAPAATTRGDEGAAQPAPRHEREQRGGRGEPRHGQPARTEPLERQLRERHGQAPQRRRRRRARGWRCGSRHAYHLCSPESRLSSTDEATDRLVHRILFGDMAIFT